MAIVSETYICNKCSFQFFLNRRDWCFFDEYFPDEEEDYISDLISKKNNGTLQEIECPVCFGEDFKIFHALTPEMEILTVKMNIVSAMMHGLVQDLYMVNYKLSH